MVHSHNSIIRQREKRGIMVAGRDEQKEARKRLLLFRPNTLR